MILSVDHGESSYDIHIEHGILAQAGGIIRQTLPGAARMAVITDENVHRLYGAALSESLAGAGYDAQMIILPPGEETKSLAAFGRVLSQLAAAGFNRHDALIALGGGVIGDLAGFAASAYMRGVAFVQIPTTLLAQVDSSVGGKTGINLAEGKNLAGAFHRPRVVIMDTAVLDTLPARELRSGQSEVVKYGAICSEALFSRLENGEHMHKLPEIIYECCRIKAMIVARDEHESGERMLLNFGHTLGHAIEKAGGYTEMTHGEAVAVGMCLAAGLGEARGLTEKGTAARLTALLRSLGLATETGHDMAELISYVKNDKKSSANGVRFVYLRRIGEGFVQETELSLLHA